MDQNRFNEIDEHLHRPELQIAEPAYVEELVRDAQEILYHASAVETILHDVYNVIPHRGGCSFNKGENCDCVRAVIAAALYAPTPTIFIYAEPEEAGSGALTCAIAEDGEVIARNDEVGPEAARVAFVTEGAYHKAYRIKYPQGYRLEWVEPAAVATHERLREAIANRHGLAASAVQADGVEGEQPGVTADGAAQP